MGGSDPLGCSRCAASAVRPTRVLLAPGSLIWKDGAGSENGWLFDVAEALGGVGHVFEVIARGGLWLGATVEDCGPWPVKHPVARWAHPAIPGGNSRRSPPDARTTTSCTTECPSGWAAPSACCRGCRLGETCRSRWVLCRSFRPGPARARPGRTSTAGSSKTACSGGGSHRVRAWHVRRPCARQVLRCDLPRSCCGGDNWAYRGGPSREERRACVKNPHHPPSGSNGLLRGASSYRTGRAVCSAHGWSPDTNGAISPDRERSPGRSTLLPHLLTGSENQWSAW